jgi:hypothetical protein
METENAIESSLLNAYMVFSKSDGSEAGACLVFADNAEFAREMAYYCDYCDHWELLNDIEAHQIKDNPQIFKEADQEKFKIGVAHVIENPKSCEKCGLWGGYLDDNDICEDCQ